MMVSNLSRWLIEVPCSPDAFPEFACRGGSGGRTFSLRRQAAALREWSGRDHDLAMMASRKLDWPGLAVMRIAPVRGALTIAVAKAFGVPLSFFGVAANHAMRRP